MILISKHLKKSYLHNIETLRQKHCKKKKNAHKATEIEFMIASLICSGEFHKTCQEMSGLNSPQNQKEKNCIK